MRLCPSAICLLLAAACALAQDPAPAVVIAPVPGWPVDGGGAALVVDVATGGTPDAPAMTAALSPFTLARFSSEWQLLQQPDQSAVLRSPAGNVCLRAGSGGTYLAVQPLSLLILRPY
jgi:hypothetical protein